MSNPEMELVEARADTRALAIRAAIGKLSDLITEFHAAKQQEERANALLSEAKAQITATLDKHNQLLAMAQLFDFDLDREYNLYVLRQNELPTQAEPRVSEHAMPTAVITASEKPRSTIKEQVISVVRQAYPNPVRSSALRQQLANVGITVHEKTVGMTLYRLSRSGTLRRDGRDWYFVPENERSKIAPQDEESPGDEPGLLLEAAE